MGNITWENGNIKHDKYLSLSGCDFLKDVYLNME